MKRHLNFCANQRHKKKNEGNKRSISKLIEMIFFFQFGTILEENFRKKGENKTILIKSRTRKYFLFDHLVREVIISFNLF
jgi:hypothetical protein